MKFVVGNAENILGKGDIGDQHFLCNSRNSFQSFPSQVRLTLSQTTILNFSKFKDFADNNCKVDKNGRKLS